MSLPPNILIIGLGPTIKPPSSMPLPADLPPHAVAEAVKSSMQKIKSAGFEITRAQLNPRFEDDGLSTLEKQLQEGKFAGIVIGFGVRGTPEFTESFEKAVQLCARCAPGVKVGFNSRPDDLFEAVVRNFGVERL